VHVFQPFQDHLHNLGGLSLGGKLGYLWHRITRKRSLGNGSGAATPLDTRKVLAHYPRLLMAHPIGEYRGKVTLLIDETSHRTFGNLGWDEVQTGGIEVHILPGDHLSYIRERAADAAAKLRELIERTSHIPA
jgi:thioesterase domain-containing protein